MRRAGHADSYLGRAQVGARRLARGGRERGGDRRNGRHLAKWPLASAGTDAPKALAVDATGALLIAGATEGALPGQTHYGDKDAFIARIVP